MQQSRGVDELHGGSELVMTIAAIGEQACAGEREHRPHPLATAGDQMPGQLGNQRDTRLHPRKDHAVDAVHVIRDESHHRLKRRGAAARHAMDIGAHGVSHVAREHIFGKHFALPCAVRLARSAP